MIEVEEGAGAGKEEEAVELQIVETCSGCQ